MTCVLPDEIVSKIMLYNSHPTADIIKEWFKDDNPDISKFCFLGYFAFKPLIKSGTNGRQIHDDYDEYWDEFNWYFK
tara:strand:- start:105 stop:335 length:231 start_codon:yes stop_codon:yes gene_type:complete